jgi:hypothetical protein
MAMGDAFYFFSATYTICLKLYFRPTSKESKVVLEIVNLYRWMFRELFFLPVRELVLYTCHVDCTFVEKVSLRTKCSSRFSHFPSTFQYSFQQVVLSLFSYLETNIVLPPSTPCRSP